MKHTCGGIAQYASEILILSVLAGSRIAAGQPDCPDAGRVHSEQRVSQLDGGFAGLLGPGDAFGVGIAAIGDLDGDGISEMAVGAEGDNEGGADRGAVWILFMQADGTVRAEQKISSTSGGFNGALDSGDNFGVSVAALGDLDGDGVVDLAVGANNDDDGGADRGAVWLLFLNADGTVKSERKISSTSGGFGGPLDNVDRFGFSVVSPGDLDGDGIPELVVGALSDDDGGSGRGAVWVLFLRTDGTVRVQQKISDTAGGFTGVLENDDFFGVSVGALGDVDGDGTGDIVVGAHGDNDGGPNRGAAWILFLNADGSVKGSQLISSTSGGLVGPLQDECYFGIGVAGVGDLDGDGVRDLVVGSSQDTDGGTLSGAVWVLFLDPGGAVKGEQKISETAGGFAGDIVAGDLFGRGVALLNDLNADGRPEIAVGSPWADDGAAEAGAVWVLTLNVCDLPPSIAQQPTSCLLNYPGGATSLSIIAEGASPLRYEWRRDGVPIVNGGHFSGADTNTLTISATPEESGHYDCVVVNDLGSATSQPAVLGIRPNPCPGDFNGDAQVNSLDVRTFLNAWTAGCP